MGYGILNKLHFAKFAGIILAAIFVFIIFLVPIPTSAQTTAPVCTPPPGQCAVASDAGDKGNGVKCNCSSIPGRGDSGSMVVSCSWEFPAGSNYCDSITATNVQSGDSDSVTENPDGTLKAEHTEAKQTGECDFIRGAELGQCLVGIAGKVGAGIMLILVSVFAALLALVGGILNWVMLITVFQFSTYFGNSEGMLVAWTVLRDIGNIVLLFGFIFIGLQTILNLGHFSVGKALPRLIIFAILINFSLFISEAIVDVSNVFSATFYQQASTVDCSGTDTMEQCTSHGIAGLILQESGITRITDFEENTLGNIIGAPSGVATFFAYLSLLILVFVMLVVFIAAIILFLIRAVVLMIVLVTSPIGFAAMAIPQFEEYSKKWWNLLISNALFAPVFLLMLLVGLKIMDGAGQIFNAGNASLMTAIMKGSTGTGGVFILYFLIIGFMIAALMSAKSIGAMGASFAVSKAKGMVTYPLGIAARASIGGGASKLQKAYDSKVARGVRRAGLGFVDDAITGGLSKTKKSSFGTGARSYEDAKKHREERTKHIDHAVEKAETKKNLKSAFAMPATTPAEIEARDSAIAAILQHMSQQELEELDQIKDLKATEKEGFADIARNLSPERFAAIMKNKDISEHTRNEMRAQRFENIKGLIDSAATADPATAAGQASLKAAKKAVRELSNKDLEQFAQGDPTTFAKLVSTRAGVGTLSGSIISDDQHDSLVKSGELTNLQRSHLKGNTKVKQFEALFNTTGIGPSSAARAIRRLNAAEVAKLPEDILTHTDVAKALTPAMLAAIQKKGELSNSEYKVIGNAIRAGGSPEAKKYITSGAGKSFWD